jgi:D-3-phosphoglycerate dehydrogenase
LGGVGGASREQKEAVVKVLIADQFEASACEALERMGCEIRVDPALGPETLVEAIAAFEPAVLIVRSTKVPKAVIDQAGPVRLIIRAGAGYDNIDISAAGARSIGVCNCPGMNGVAVAELTMAHLLNCDRRVASQTAELRAGHWNKQEYSKARGLKGLRLGIVGVGSIGRAVISRAKAFEMGVAAWSRSMTPERAKSLGVEFGGSTRQDLLKMVSGCDAVSIHVASTPDTKDLCDQAFFDAMTEGAYFVNTSRGSVVDEKALAAAIQAKGIRAGLDVYRDQPAEKEAEWRPGLADLEGVASMSHHVGASTDQAQTAVGVEAVRLVEVFKTSGRFENCVNEDELAGAGVDVVSRAGQSAAAGG